MHKAVIFLSVVLILAMAAMGAYIWQNEQDKKSLLAQIATPEPSPLVFEVPTSTPEPLAASNSGTVPNTATTGSITGSISFPSEGIPAMEVCAEDSVTAKTYCTDEMLEDAQYQNGMGYRLDVPAGQYTVYAKLPNDSYKAYYNEFVTCGLSVDCPSHKAIMVKVTAGNATSKVDPQDWYNQ